MLTFQYTARDSNTGKEITADVQADSENAAAKLLIAQGLSPLNIELKKEKSLFGALKGRVRTKDKVIFSRQLSTLINAGLPLAQSLRSVSEQTENVAFKVIGNQIITDVEGGTTFAKALQKHPKVFNRVYTSLIQAGETSGTLGEALERIADQQEKDAELVNKVRGALVYPAIVLLVIGAVIIFMLTAVLPQVELLYTDLNQELPFITAFLLAVSKFITGFWWLVLIIIIGGGFLAKRYSETTEGTKFFDGLKMKIPLFGRLFRKLYMARFCRTGQTLVTSGVPMLEMLKITGNAVNNVHIEAAILRAADKVKGGKSLSESLGKEPDTFLKLVPQMLKIGEDSGSVDAMMDKAASFYETEIDNEVKTISTTIEPILMVVLAVVAGLMVGAILLPVYGLVGNSIV